METYHLVAAIKIRPMPNDSNARKRPDPLGVKGLVARVVAVGVSVELGLGLWVKAVGVSVELEVGLGLGVCMGLVVPFLKASLAFGGAGFIAAAAACAAASALFA